MKRLLVFVVLACASGFAQDQPKPVVERTQKLVILRYADSGMVRTLLRSYPVDVTSAGPRYVALVGTSAGIAAAEAAIKQLDVQPKNIELTVFFVTGTEQSNPAAGNPIPQEIEPVVAQLRKTFAFKNYRLLDALTLRTRSGVGAESSGVLDSPGTVPRLTQFRIREANVSEDGTTVRIDGLRAGLRIPTPGQGGSTTYIDTGLNTDVDVKVGQKVVVGKSSLAGPDTALFLVLSAQVIQ